MDSGIAAAVEDYLDGMILADAETTRRAFHPQAAIVGHEAHGLEWLSVEDFAALCAKAGPQPGGREAARARVQVVQQVGDIACVTLEDDYDGSRYTDFLTMIRTGGQWRIVNKTFVRHDLGTV